MGVYCTVYVCILEPAPLPEAVRARIVAVAIEHQLLFAECAFGVPRKVVSLPPPTTLWQRWTLRFRRPPVVAAGSFVEDGLNAYRALTTAPHTDVLAKGDAGPWLVDRALMSPHDFIVASAAAKWNGKIFEGGFAYLASSRPVPVRVGNAYVSEGRRSRFVPEDGVVGTCFDVATLTGRHFSGGNEVSRSRFVRDLKRVTDAKITCRASWW